MKMNINCFEIPDTLIGLGETININIKQTMNQMKLPNL